MASTIPKKTRAKKSKIPPRDTLTEQQRKEIEEAFDVLDTDGSGPAQPPPAAIERTCGKTLGFYVPAPNLL